MKIVDYGVRYELKVPNPESEFVGPRYRVYNFWKNILVKELSDYPNNDIIRQQKKYFVKVIHDDYEFRQTETIIFDDEEEYNEYLQRYLNGKNTKTLSLKK